MTLGLVRVLGWLVIVHGLSHAVLPLRGSTAPALLIEDWVPAGLYMIAMIGFVAAGIGLLGLRPFDRSIGPVLVLSSGLSLVAIARLGDSTLWVGGAFDVVLFFLGLWRGYGGWPAHPQHGSVWHRVGLACGFAFLGYVALVTVLWPWHRTWGSTRAELALSLPGDEGPRSPAFEIQHAVTIEAPPEAVWPWLVQLGQDRAGFYSYDWLERMFGVEVRNVAEIHPEWQQRAIGDFGTRHATHVSRRNLWSQCRLAHQRSAREPRPRPRTMGGICAGAHGGWSHAIHHSLDGEPGAVPGLGGRVRVPDLRITAFHHGAAHDARHQGAGRAPQPASRVGTIGRQI